MEPTFKFTSELWIWHEDNAGSWHFLSINSKLTEEIKSYIEGPRRGFGSVKVTVQIGKTSWKTSIFPTKEGKYLLPIKLQVRKAENLTAGKKVTTIISLI